MSQVIQTHKAVHKTLEGDRFVTYKLVDAGVCYLVKTYHNDNPDPAKVQTGKGPYINKLWYELTKKKACLK